MARGRSKALLIIGICLLALGVGVLGLGVFAFMRASGNISTEMAAYDRYMSELNSLIPNRATINRINELQQKIDAVRPQLREYEGNRSIAIVILVGGVAIMLAGGVLMLVHFLRGPRALSENGRSRRVRDRRDDDDEEEERPRWRKTSRDDASDDERPRKPKVRPRDGSEDSDRPRKRRPSRENDE